LDPVGNRLSATSTISGINSGAFSFNPDDQELIESYDADGNTTATGVKSFAYDSGDRLKSMNGGAVTITYDGDGNRVAKTANGGTTRYLVDDLNPTGYAQVVEETGATQRTYTYGLQRISEYQVINNAWTSSFYGYDGLGNVRVLFNAFGAITDTNEYDAFGNLINFTGATPNVYLYRGESYDSDLGLYYMRARYYNPLTGRFMSRDPEDGIPTDPKTLHKYVYASGDPINLADPSGRAPAQVGVAGSDAIDYGGLVITALQAASGAIATGLQ
jgi:RHS repeat-associated protein